MVENRGKFSREKMLKRQKIEKIGSRLVRCRKQCDNVKKDKVWYAVYGTNLNEQRFSCYIKGGTPEGTSKPDVGCRDKTPAVDGGMISIPFQLYFAKSSPKWENKSVGFLGLEVDPTIRTLGRKYLITKEQFEDVFRQENKVSMKQTFNIDFIEAREKGALIVKESLYGRVIFLGIEEGFPIFTLTAYWDYNPEEVLPPSSNYLKHIIKGIRQTHNISDDKILEYLSQKPGISNHLSEKDLLNIIQGS